MSLPDELLKVIFFDSPYTQTVAPLINKRIYQLTFDPDQAINILAQCKNPAIFELSKEDPGLIIVNLDILKGEMAVSFKPKSGGYTRAFVENIYTHQKIKIEVPPFLSFLGFIGSHLYCISASEGIKYVDKSGKCSSIAKAQRGKVNQIMIANDHKRIAYTLGEGTSICVLDTTTLEPILAKNNLEKTRTDLRSLGVGIDIDRDIHLPENTTYPLFRINMQLCTELAFAGDLLIAAYQNPDELKIYDMQGNLIK